MNLPLLRSYDNKNDLIMKKMVVNQVKKKETSGAAFTWEKLNQPRL